MFWGSDEDPGGGSKEPSDQEQQVLVSQLKEMLKKTDQTVSQEKVAEYANTLTKMNARAKRTQLKEKESGAGGHTRKLDTPSSEKINLLRQQLEENKVKLAERGKNQKGIEEMVTQIKAQLDDSQHMISLTPLNISLIEDRVEYSPNTNPQELYQILLNKDKRINEMHMKIVKLEANVLDLQENVKEKDSVIDARTKAITLMSENLSKKSKTTLDSLDDTKEQMRQMQENFIQIEEDTRNQIKSLLREINEKNITIESLRKRPSSGQEELSEHLSEVLSLREHILELEELNKNLKSPKKSQEKTEYETKINELENIISNLKTKGNQSSDEKEIEKLRKQLDESNKNMIKAKAQQKSKIKELNKKIDGFKKISDANAAIVKLEAENCKLSQKVAELEEEKGHLQLNMVESKDSINLEDVKDLELKIDELEASVDSEKLRSEELLRQNEEYESQVSGLKEKLDSRIKSDVASIEFEELVEKLEKEKVEMLAEKETLLSKVDGLVKEKQEICLKLETYMNENMELIDRLEKLSAEKVSSAESIEIVENLTQQEKLEIEAYQKNTENVEKSEETSELLQKIELFTAERHEVMDKMEALTTENNQLNLKLKEIENNRDVLEETYEQLQTEKEELGSRIEALEKYKTAIQDEVDILHRENKALKSPQNGDDLDEFKALVEIQKQEIRELKVKIMSHDVMPKTDSHLIQQFNDLEDEKFIILEENERLAKELDSLKANFEDEVNKIRIEAEKYASVIEENKTELTNSTRIIENLTAEFSLKNDQLEAKNVEINTKTEELNVKNEEIKLKNAQVERSTQEIDRLQGLVLELNKTVEKLERENEESVETMSEQLNELKSSLMESLGQTENYDGELERYKETVEQLNGRIEETSEEIARLSSEKEEKDRTNESLRKEIEEKDAAFKKVTEELRIKCEHVQKQVESNTNSVKPLESQVIQLENKNKEQLEKMKKIAANLKKKSVELKNAEEKFRNERKEKDDVLTELSNVKVTLTGVEHDYSELRVLHETKLSEYENIFKDLQVFKDEISVVNEKNTSLTNQTLQYSAQLDDLQNIIREYENQIDTLRNELEMVRSNEHNTSNLELSGKEELITNLNEELANLRYSNNALEMKIFELQSFIETQDAELTKYKEKSNVLEEGLSKMEERRLSLEQKTLLLGSELEEKELSFEEAVQHEDYLEKRLETLIAKDEEIEKRLKDSMNENQTLVRQNLALNEEIENFKKLLTNATTELKERNENFNRLSLYEEENFSLKNIIGDIESEVKRLGGELKLVRDERDKNESELLEQVEQCALERKSLVEQCEVSLDKITSLNVLQAELNQEISELNIKLDQQTVDFEENINKFRALEIEHNKSLMRIEELNNEVEFLRKEKLDELSNNQKQNEIDNLQRLLSDKNEELVSLRSHVDSRLQKEIDNLKQLLTERNVELEKGLNEVSELKVNLQEKNVELFETGSQFEFVKNVMKDLEFENARMSERIVELENQRHENIQVVEAKPLFSWPETSNDPFSEILEAKPDLEQKIKTLELTLSRVEKEREEALTHCAQLSSELSKLVHHETNPYEGMKPVVEEVCVKETSYLCYPDNQSEPVKVDFDDAFGDDGWGCAAEEIKLEQEHIVQSQRTKSSELQERIQALEIERVNHLEELKQAQIKSGKLIKKLKEFKARNEQLLVKSKNDGFEDLNEAIVDELKTQIATLEKKLKEVIVECEKEKSDKISLVKKTEILAAANERMIELKEKQDVEMMGWQHQNRELSNKLQRLEQFNWDEAKPNEKLETTVTELDKLNELNETIKELTLDNEELQTLLEEQRNLRIEAEKSIKAMRSIECGETDVLKFENAQLASELTEMRKSLHETKTKLADVSQLLQTNYAEKTQMQATILENNITIEGLNIQLNELETFTHVDSYEKQKANFERRDEFKLQLENELSVQLENELKLQLETELKLQLENKLKLQLEAELKVQLEKELRVELESKLRLQLENELRVQLENELRLQLESELKVNLEEDLTPKLEQKLRLQLEEELKLKLEEFKLKMKEELKLECELKLESEMKLKSQDELKLQSRDELKLQSRDELKLQSREVLNLNEEDELKLKSEEFKLQSEGFKLQLEEEFKLKLEEEFKLKLEEEFKLKLEEEFKLKLEEEFKLRLDELKFKLEEEFKVKLEEELNVKSKLNLEELTSKLEDKLKLKLDEELRLKLEAEWKFKFEEESKFNSKDLTFSLVELTLKFLAEREVLRGRLDAEREELRLLGKERLKQKMFFEEEIEKLTRSIETLRMELNQKLDQINDLNLQLKNGIKTNEELNVALTENEKLTRLLKENEDEHQLKLTATIEQITGEWSRHVEQRGNDVAESWKLHVDTRENEFAAVEETLRKSLLELENKVFALKGENLELRQHVDEEIRGEIDRITALQEEVYRKQNSLDEKEKEISNLIENEKFTKGTITKLNELLEEKSLEIEERNLLIKTEQENEKVAINLKLELQEKSNEIRECQLNLDEFKNQIEQYKTKITSLTESEVELNEKLHENSTNYDRIIGNYELQMNEATRRINEAHQHVNESRQQINNYELRLQEDQHLIQALSQEIENYKTLSEHVQSKEIEIARLNALLEEKENDFEYAFQNKSLEFQSVLSEQTKEIDSFKRRLQEEEIKLEETLSAKELEIDSYKQQYEILRNTQTQEIELIGNLQNEVQVKNEALAEIESKLFEEDKQYRDIIEAQVLKIEELKKELFEKSNDYDSVIAQITQFEEEKTNVTSSNRTELNDEDLSDPVSRAELDLALYMLHQRDVRCEELTVELMQLLEERDTLQLRLSNAIREKERMKDEGNRSGNESTEEEIKTRQGSPSKGAVPKVTVPKIAADPSGGSNESFQGERLADKLSELKTIGYRKDKTLMDEQQLRRMQQFSILQQHKDEVAKLPPEAAARLVDASYTLSRDVQSPSKVLLNWLWGRSTPKVNNV